MAQSIPTPAQPRIINPYWALVGGAVVGVLMLGLDTLHDTPITPLDIWYQPVQLQWIPVLGVIGAAIWGFRDLRRTARRAAANPAQVTQEQQQAQHKRGIYAPGQAESACSCFLCRFWHRPSISLACSCSG